MTSAELTASLARTNNGYLFAPTAAELICARAHPELFIINFRGQISARGFRYDPETATKPAPTVRRDEFDYEGAILARQERWMMDY